MPQKQVAAVSVYDVNAPAVAATVLVLRQRFARGGKVLFNFRPTTSFGGHDETAENDATVSLEVSDDGTTFVATTAAANLAVVTDEVVGALTERTFEIALRQGVDNFVRVVALGGTRLQIQVSPNHDLELVQEGQDLRDRGPTGP